MNIYFGKLYAGDNIFRTIVVHSGLGLSRKYEDNFNIQCSGLWKNQQKIGEFRSERLIVKLS